MTECNCTLLQLKKEYSLEDAICIWESHHIAKYNEYQAFLKHQQELNKGLKIKNK